MSEGFDELLHAPHRLRIGAILAESGEVEFGVIRDALSVSDSVLSKQLKILEKAGYVSLRKGIVNTRPRTWVLFTRSGRSAFVAHMRQLKIIAASVNDLEDANMDAQGEHERTPDH